MFAKAFINKPTADAYDDADDVGDPIIDVCTTVETRLDKLNDTAKYACRDEDGKQAQTSRACQWKHKCRKGDKVNDFVGSFGR